MKKTYIRKENHKIPMKSLLLTFLLLSGVAFAQNTLIICINNSTAEVNTSFDIYIDSVVTDVVKTERITCPAGCDNSTGGLNDCFPNPADPETLNIFILSGMGLVGIGIIFSVITVFAQAIWIRTVFLFISLITILSSTNLFFGVSNIIGQTLGTSTFLGFYITILWISVFILGMFIFLFTLELLDLMGRSPQWAKKLSKMVRPKQSLEG